MREITLGDEGAVDREELVVPVHNRLGATVSRQDEGDEEDEEDESESESESENAGANTNTSTSTPKYMNRSIMGVKMKKRILPAGRGRSSAGSSESMLR